MTWKQELLQRVKLIPPGPGPAALTLPNPDPAERVERGGGSSFLSAGHEVMDQQGEEEEPPQGWIPAGASGGVHI